MEQTQLITFFGWASLINIAILLIWLLGFALAKEFIYTLHSKWFDIHKEQFELAHYFSMAIYKLLNLLFFITPYLIFKFLL